MPYLDLNQVENQQTSYWDIKQCNQSEVTTFNFILNPWNLRVTSDRGQLCATLSKQKLYWKLDFEWKIVPFNLGQKSSDFHSTKSFKIWNFAPIFSMFWMRDHVLKFEFLEFAQCWRIWMNGGAARDLYLSSVSKPDFDKVSVDQSPLGMVA